MPMMRVPPGRAGRLWLRARLDVAGRGVSLLEQKVRILGEERRRLQALSEDTGRDWARTCRDAQTWTLRAGMLGGQRSIEHATPNGPATITATWMTTMGIRYPDRADYQPPREDPTVVVDSCAILEARAAHRAALAAAASHAAALAALRIVDREFHTTRLRALALRRHWLPSLRAALTQIDLDLEEQERAEGIRLKSATAAAQTTPASAFGERDI
jgi:V/A-type H+-transporting ATPase subunit D